MDEILLHLAQLSFSVGIHSVLNTLYQTDILVISDSRFV